MQHWAGRTPPAWIHEIADDRPGPLAGATTVPDLSPAEGDIVLKPSAGSGPSLAFRLETWRTHALLDGPFLDVREAVQFACELGAIMRLPIWLDYSDDPERHDIDPMPLYCVP